MKWRKLGQGADRAGIVEAIRRAGKKLGRAPTWAELRRIGGVPESRVRMFFSSLADAVRAAGLEPARQGLKIEKEELLRDFARVKEKLGRWPSRNEYVKHGQYSAGSFYSRFGSWCAIQQQLTTKGTEKSGDLVIGRSGDRNTVAKALNRDPSATSTPGEKSGDLVIGGSGDRNTAATALNRDPSATSTRSAAGDEKLERDKAIAMRWAGTMAAIPGELAGKRRVTDAVCAMIVNTLMGDEAGLKWQRVMMGQACVHGENCQECQNCQTLKIENRLSDCAGSTNAALLRMDSRDVPAVADVNNKPRLARVNSAVVSGGVLYPDRPVMGPPLERHALRNAPGNELGVVFLFGMLAGELGFQVDSVWGRYPDIEAWRQIQPGKWQRVRIEVEYESANFLRHGHDPGKCDVIVCWKHNWRKCPKHIEVIELRKVLGL